MKIANDNNETFLPVGLHVNLILNRLRNERHLRELSEPNEKQNEDASRDPDASNRDQEKSAEQRRYVDQRLRDLAAFERRARGNEK